jgi:hypothetical protein
MWLDLQAWHTGCLVVVWPAGRLGDPNLGQSNLAMWTGWQGRAAPMALAKWEARTTCQWVSLLLSVAPNRQMFQVTSPRPVASNH